VTNVIGLPMESLAKAFQFLASGAA
jgi:hypothetical protein